MTRAWRRFVHCLLACLALAAAPVTIARAEKLVERLTPDVMAVVFPGGTKLGPESGSPPAVPVYRGEIIAGYVFSTLDILASPGYSSIPFDVIGCVDIEGRITGAKVIYHREPYIMGDRVRAPLLDTFLKNHEGKLAPGPNAALQPPDFVAGATISARAMRAATFDAARLVLRSRVSRQEVKVQTLDIEGFRVLTWEQLVAQGSIVERRVLSRDITDMLGKAGIVDGKLDVTPIVASDTYIEFAAGIFTPAMIGRNLIGARAYEDYIQSLGRNGLILVVASRGPYDFLGYERFKAATGNKFDRLRIIQEERVGEFTSREYQRLGTGGPSGGIRAFDHAALFNLPRGFEFDPLKPWRLEVLVHAQTAAGKTSLALPLDYQLASAHILLPPEAPVPPWVEAWRDARQQVFILGIALTLLTLVLAFQQRLAKTRVAHRWVRSGFLLFTLVWIGWIAGAQLSIVNVFNYVRAPFQRFDIGFYLAEPLIVMIALYTTFSLLILGRGVFCGWLCPFGALQELLGQAARALKLPQWNPAWKLQNKLWWGKYLSAAIILGLAFVSLDAAVTASEIEPFKTAINSHFTRSWPYLIYAGAIVFIGLFTERAYCRFLCPLGGFLAALDKLHLVDMLKRRPQCGSPCSLCKHSCPVKAIAPTGKIVMSECFQCLDCQVEYHDDHRCPPLAQARKRVERAALKRSVAA